MRLLILSDSHRYMDFMERCVEVLRPDCVIHLGDYYPDGHSLRALSPGASFYQVPGNCDEYSCDPFLPRILMPTIDGVRFYLTHGHHHNPDNLPPLPEGSVFLSGHTHVKIDEVHKGVRCLNPGSVSIPKDGSHSCLIFENGKFSFRILEE